MRSMKRLFSAGIPIKLFALLSALALLALLVPMLKAAQYDVPSADDYANGLTTYRALKTTGSAAEVLKAAWNRVYELYYSWQGTFTAIFLFTLNPMIFGEQYYQLGPWIILITLLAGIFYLTVTVWSGMFRAPKTESCIIAVIWAVLCTQFLPRASQGIYWYTGAIYYSFYFSLAAIAFALLLRYILRKTGDRGLGKLIAASLLFLFIGGGNLVTCLTAAVVLLSMEFVLLVRKRKEWKTLLLPTLCFFFTFGLNAAAPGNSQRQVYFPQPGPVQAVFLSFREAWNFGREWFSLPVLALILLLIPLFWRIASRPGLQFPLPGLVSLYSVCLTGVMFYPPIYAMTEHNLRNLGRITNIIFFGMMGLTIFNLFYWIGWLSQKGILSEKLFPASRKNRFSLAYLLLMLLLFGFGMTQIKWFDTTSISAFRSYRSGQMGNYWHTYKERLEILKDPEVKDAVLKRFPYRPYVLFYQELSADPADNVTIAEWYGKDSVIIH